MPSFWNLRFDMVAISCLRHTMIHDADLLHLLRRMAEFDTPTICNAIEMFGIRSRREGYMDDRIRAVFPDLPPMVGFASTATLRSETGSDGEDVIC